MELPAHIEQVIMHADPRIRAELRDLALRGLESYDKPCPYVTTSRAGTSYCQLAAQYDPAAVVRAALEAATKESLFQAGKHGASRIISWEIVSALRALSTDEGVEKILKGVK